MCFFTNSGSESNELALRLARVATNKNDVIVLDGAYHGNTVACVDMSPYKYEGKGGFPQRDYVHKVPAPDTFRGPITRDDPSAGKKYAEDVRLALESAAKNGRGVAAFFAESVLGCAGQIVLPPGYLKHVYKHVRDLGGVCVADEVQVGFGRVGSHFWAFETQGVVPDIVVLGKPMGNGMSVGGVVTTKAIADKFNNGMVTLFTHHCT